MASTMPNVVSTAPLTMREIRRPSPAKANLTARENRPAVGAALRRAMRILDLDVKQVAVLCGFVDDVTGEPHHAQVSRWLSGAENVQLDRIWGTPLHGPFAIELASDAAGVVIETAVTIRRTA
jgi:hypothetical protein